MIFLPNLTHHSRKQLPSAISVSQRNMLQNLKPAKIIQGCTYEVGWERMFRVQSC